MKENYPSGKRKLKVYSKTFPMAGHDIVFFLEICLCGKWLQDSRFDFDQAVIIQHEKDKIIIINADEPNE